MLDLIMRERACEIGDAIRWAREFCGMREPQGVNHTLRAAKNKPDNIRIVHDADDDAKQVERKSKRALEIVNAADQSVRRFHQTPPIGGATC